MYSQKDIIPEVLEKIKQNYNDILDAEINHPENIVTFNTVEEMKKYFDSL